MHFASFLYLLYDVTVILSAIAEYFCLMIDKMAFFMYNL